MPRRASAAMYSGCSLVVKIAFIASVISSAGRMPSTSRHSRTSPRGHATRRLDQVERRARARRAPARARSTGIARLPLRELVLVGLVRARRGRRACARTADRYRARSRPRARSRRRSACRAGAAVAFVLPERGALRQAIGCDGVAVRGARARRPARRRRPAARLRRARARSDADAQRSVGASGLDARGGRPRAAAAGRHRPRAARRRRHPPPARRGVRARRPQPKRRRRPANVEHDDAARGRRDGAARVRARRPASLSIPTTHGEAARRPRLARRSVSSPAAATRRRW